MPDNLLDLNKKTTEGNSSYPSIRPVAPTQSAGTIRTEPTEPNQYQPSSPIFQPPPKKSKLRLIVLIIIIILIIAAGVYYLLFANKNNVISNLLTGTTGFNFTKTEDKVGGGLFVYNSTLDGLIYQSSDGKIYGDYYDVNEMHYLTFNPLGAKFVSLSTDGQYAVVYFDNIPVIDSGSDQTQKLKDSLKDAKGNYFLVNLTKNEMFNIGNNLSFFVWSPTKLYMMRNGFEVLAYDFRVANYQAPVYQGEINPYVKITDLNQSLVFADIMPGTDILYLITEKDGTRALYTLDGNSKAFNKIMDTKASSIIFSPHGSCYALFDNERKNTVVYKSEDNSIIYTISDEVVMPMVLAWNLDENLFYYFSKTKDGSDYFGLNKYDLTSKSKTVVFSENDKKFSSPTYFEINPAKKLLYFASNKADAIYQLEVK